MSSCLQSPFSNKTLTCSIKMHFSIEAVSSLQTALNGHCTRGGFPWGCSAVGGFWMAIVADRSGSTVARFDRGETLEFTINMQWSLKSLQMGPALERFWKEFSQKFDTHGPLLSCQRQTACVFTHAESGLVGYWGGGTRSLVFFSLL